MDTTAAGKENPAYTVHLVQVQTVPYKCTITIHVVFTQAARGAGAGKGGVEWTRHDAHTNRQTDRQTDTALHYYSTD